MARYGVFAVAMVCVAMMWGCVASAQPSVPKWESSLVWKASPVGGPAEIPRNAGGEMVDGGSHEWNEKDGVLTLLDGGSVGLNVKGADQVQFIAMDRKAGDFEIIVRLAQFTAAFAEDQNAVAGIMVRGAEDAPGSPMAAVYYGTKNNDVHWMSRMPAERGAQTSAWGMRLANAGPMAKSPLWLRMVCVDGKFAAYRSRDGQLWSMISNRSGDRFGVKGPLRVGVFCSSGSAERKASAVFDSIQIGDPHLRWRVSWVGNSGGDLMDNHVSNVSAAMWVAADGTCYTSSYWDEGFYPVRAYRDGKVRYNLPVGTTQSGDPGSVTGNGDRLYVAYVNHIVELDLSAADKGFTPRPLLLSVALLDQTHHSVVRGMASNGKELFVSDGRENLIRVATLDPMAEGKHSELTDRSFAFDNPGPMVFDKRGLLWIIQRQVAATDDKPGTKGAVRCYTVDGKFTGKELPDVTNPTAIAYDAANDQLLVGEGIPDLNIRFYAELDKDMPKLARTFGEKGGIYSGKNPGLIHDPAAGGYARFPFISGLGVDAKGNLYTASPWPGSDIRAFTPEGKFAWQLHSLVFCNTYDFDPASDGTELYGNSHHVRLDLSKTKPGAEQTYVGYNWDQRRYGSPWRHDGTQSILRRLGKENRLIQYTSGQGDLGDTHIFRHEGELMIPCGAIRRSGTVWIDLNGDGRETPDEVTPIEGGQGWYTALVVDVKGDIWLGVTGVTGSTIRRFKFQGLNDAGVPVYGGKRGEDYEDTPVPDEGGVTNAFGMNVRMDYDLERDIMVIYYPARQRESEDNNDPSWYKFARYDNWSKGNREATWKHDGLTLHNPEHVRYFMYEKENIPHFGFVGMQMVGDYVFFATIFGEVLVHDLATGEVVEILGAGPEVAGFIAWEDASMGLRAFKRKNGEYLILTENGGFSGKNNLYRWRP